LAKSKVQDYNVPSIILNFNQTIDFKIQDNVYKYINKSKKSILPTNDINYESCLKVLKEFYDLYSWNKTEKKLANINSLKYYAVLMNQWINGLSLSQIISQSIEWYDEKNYKIKVNYSEYEIFNKSSKRHINFLIELIIDDIEYILRFLLEKYFNHYHQILINIVGEERAGDNWATLLEYGTQNPLIIALQNLGISRNTAIKIFKNNRDALLIKDKKLIGVHKEKILKSLKVNSLEHDELKKVL